MCVTFILSVVLTDFNEEKTELVVLVVSASNLCISINDPTSLPSQFFLQPHADVLLADFTEENEA